MSEQERAPSVIMVVDDDPDVRESILEVLQDHDYATVGVANGQEALDELRKRARKPAMILLDMMMPVMDGRQFRVAQRKDVELRAIPVVVISAHASAELAAQEMDAAGALKKPFDLKDLLSMIKRVAPG